MGKLKINKHTNFTVLSNEVLQDTELSLKAKGMIALMYSLPDDWNFSIRGLCTLCKDGETSISATLKELENSGYLKRTKIKTNQGYFDVIYDIYDVKQNNLLENQNSENPCVENPSKEKPYKENDHNIKEINNKEINNKEINNKEINNKEINNKNKSTASGLSDSLLDNEFNEVWNKYPRKQGKENAKKAYIKSRKAGVEQATIEQGIEKYLEYIKANNIEQRFIKQGSTWFNQQCWNDEYNISSQKNKTVQQQQNDEVKELILKAQRGEL